MTFVDFVLQIHRTLARAEIAHAFGGALALAYVAEPRGTVDVERQLIGLRGPGMYPRLTRFRKLLREERG